MVSPYAAKFVGRRATGVKRSGSGRGPAVRSELWIETESPPLCGRLDAVRSGRIVEFKTPDPDEAHEEQMRFYALLWWLKYGVAPSALEVIYPRKATCITVGVPSVEALASLRDLVAQDIASIGECLASGEAEARPGNQQCPSCSVRQHCDAFWVSDETRGLRAPLHDSPAQGLAVWADVSLTSLPVSYEAAEHRQLSHRGFP